LYFWSSPLAAAADGAWIKIKTSTAYRFAAYHVLPDSPQMQKDFLYVIASLMARSSDPTGPEVLRIAKANGVLSLDVGAFQEYPGRGSGGLITFPDEQRPRAVIMGTRKFLEQCGLETPAILEVTSRQWEGEESGKIVLVGWDAWVRGVLKFVRA
jgi:cation transport ATPase